MTAAGRPRSIKVPAAFRDLPIMWKLLLPFLVLLMAVGSVGAYIIVRDLSSKSAAALGEQLTLRALDARSFIHDRELDLLESANYATNQQGMVEALAAERPVAVGGLLRSVIALKTDLAIVAATNEQGASVSELVRSGSAITPASGTDWSSFAPVRAALERETKASGFVRLGDKVLMIMVAPVCSGASGCAPVGFAIAGFDAAQVARAIAMATSDTGRGAENVTLYDEDGRILTSTAQAPPSVRLGDTTQIEQRRLRVGGEDVATAYAAFTLAGSRAGAVAVTIPAGTAFGSVGGPALGLVGLLVLAMAAAIGLGAAVSRLILRQLRALLETSRELGEGKLSARAPVLSEDEHGELAVALNRMAEQVEASHETLELQVEQRTEAIRRLMQDRTEFFAGLSHELRTPLAVILTQADMLVGTNGSRAARGEASETIRASAGQLLGVVNDILDLARAEAGSIDVHLRPVRLPELLRDIEPMLVRLGAASDIEVKTRLPGRLPMVAADAARLRDVFVNLVDNAIKYTPPGGNIQISAEREGGDVRVSIADTGVGIPSKIGDRVFEPFYRVPGTRPQREQASSGLGLALTRRWVEAQGGTITWAPNPGGGTVFVFTMPVARTAGRSPSGRGRTRSGIARRSG